MQVYRAVSKVRETLGFDLWYSNYCSERAYRLMLSHLSGRRGEGESFETNVALARSIESLYRKHDCWTWPFDDYPYFESARFVLDGRRETQRLPGSLLPLNFIDVDGLPGSNPSALVRADRKFRRLARRLRQSIGTRAGH